MLDLLTIWREDPERMPLIIRGARQVGKSWLVNSFAKSFENFIELNFDLDESACQLFAGQLTVQNILDKITMFAAKPIEPGKTLLFFDEIQECPRAIKMLRYFKEQLPQLHVIAAGSLLDFMLDQVGLPVGRVQFLYLNPLSFGEYLTAIGRDELRQGIKRQLIDQALHEVLCEEVKNYMWLGGMPAVVHSWIKFRDPMRCQSLQDRLLVAYQQDFHKYAKQNQIDNVDQVFFSIPRQLGKKFKYKDVNEHIKSSSLKSALMLLAKAGVAKICYHSNAQGLPLSAGRNSQRFKVYFFDIGLAQRLMQLNLKDWLTTPLDINYLGAIAEQLVAQEYLAHSSPELPTDLYYWHREGGTSNAEVDFLFVKDGKIIPAEVKSGTKGGMKSLNRFLETHTNTAYALKISQNLMAQHGDLHELSLYGIEAWLKPE